MKTQIETLIPELNQTQSNSLNHEELITKTNTLTAELLHKINAYWRAANYLSVGQIYLYDNPLLKEPLKLSHVKPLVVGHWGTTPGQNFIYVHLNRVIKKYDLDMIYIAGPGHGGPALVGNVYLEGTWSEIYPNVSQDEAGLKKLFMQFSFPGGISSHVAPTTPGSIHEGGELGTHSAMPLEPRSTIPGPIVACVIGDGPINPNTGTGVFEPISGAINLNDNKFSGRVDRLQHRLAVGLFLFRSLQPHRPVLVWERAGLPGIQHRRQG